MKQINNILPFLLYFLIALSPLTETIYAAALPDISFQLHADGALTQRATTAYYVGFALGIFTLGRISDILGRRPVILFGIMFYIVFTMIITFVSKIEFFILCRFLQAYGASVGSVVAQAIARDSYKGTMLSYVYAGLSIVISAVPAVGSLIGGYIIEYYQSWQYVFKFLTIVASILIFVYYRWLPETNCYIGIAQNNTFYDVLKILIKDKILLSYAFIVGVYNGICFGFYIQAPFIFINHMHMLPSDYGKLFLILSASSVTGGVLCMYLIKRFFSIIKLKMLGLSFSVIAISILFIFTWMPIHEYDVMFVSLMIFLPMGIQLIGHALIVPMLLRSALADYDKVKGAAGSFFGALYYLVTAFISFTISMLHSHTINNFVYLCIILITFSIILFYNTLSWKHTRVRPTFQ